MNVSSYAPRSMPVPAQRSAESAEAPGMERDRDSDDQASKAMAPTERISKPTATMGNYVNTIA